MKGISSISGNINLFTEGYNNTNNNIDLFINGLSSKSGTTDLFIGGYQFDSGNTDLYIQGYLFNSISNQTNLFINSHSITLNDNTLFIYGNEFSNNTVTLYINGSGIIPVNNFITLFINGITEKPTLSCPTLDPEAAIQISSNIISLYQSHIDALINQLGKNVILNLPPQKNVCPNCEQEILGRRSVGVYKIDGPRPFKRGRKCPYCKGNGFLETLVQKCIKCLIKWNPKDYENFGISIQNPENIVRLKTHLIYMKDLLRAETAIIQYDEIDVVKSQVRKLTDAIPIGLREDKYCISFWELI